jgi:hypothetical protein
VRRIASKRGSSIKESSNLDRRKVAISAEAMTIEVSRIKAIPEYRLADLASDVLGMDFTCTRFP